MTLKAKLGIEDVGMLPFAVFYAIVGVAEVYVLVTSSFTLFHIGALGLLSLFTAYGLLRMKRWTVPLVVILFFLETTVSATTLANSVGLQTFEGALLFHVTLITHLVITLVASIYIVAQREKFQ